MIVPDYMSPTQNNCLNQLGTDPTQVLIKNMFGVSEFFAFVLIRGISYTLVVSLEIHTPADKF